MLRWWSWLMVNPWRAGFMEGLRPEEPLTVSQWSDRYRRLSSKASAEPGPWRTGRTPYLREPMDCLSSSSPVQRVVMMFAAQTGKTEAGSNWLGYVIDHAPGPMLCVQPTVEMAKRLSKQRLESLINETPCLAQKIAPARSRDSGNTMFAKEYLGGILLLTLYVWLVGVVIYYCQCFSLVCAPGRLWKRQLAASSPIVVD